MNQPQPTPLYNGDLLRLSPQAIHIPGRRPIPLANVGGAVVEIVPPNRLAGLSVAVIGLLLAVPGLLDGGLFWGTYPLFALLGLLAGLAIALAARERYRLRIDLRDGRAHYTPTTADRTQARRAAQAINEAAGRQKATPSPQN